jgi:hypothetical protein
MTNKDKPNILYHYTTQEGLKGILSEKSLWATKIQYLNDASELTRPLDTAHSILEKISENKDNKNVNVLKEMILDIDIWKNINICVASFCKNGDLLSQWRGYGVYGSAYSIGFDTSKLEEGLERENYQFQQCQYYDEKAYFDEINNLVLKAVEKPTKEDRGYIDFIVRLITRALTMKLKCFEEEDEWRVVSQNPKSFTNDKFKFRSGRSMIIPYFDLPFEPSAIVEIIIGPCQHPDLVRSAVYGMALKYELKNITQDSNNIKVSKIPYRVF